jgi:ribosomal protein S21
MAISVTVYNGDIESALRVFKRKMLNSGILEEYKERQEFKSPSQIKHERKSQYKRKSRFEAGAQNPKTTG